MLKWLGLLVVGVRGAGRRGFLNLLAGLGLGAAVAEVYERLYNIPSLEERFRAEVNYWVDKYSSAYARLNSANAELNNLAAQHDAALKKIEDLKLEVRRLDGLEAESSTAISLYKQQVEEAIKGLKNTIEKYRSILGEERVAFESASLKVLEELKFTKEDLRSTNEKLQKLLSYFPMIRNLSWRPTRVVNDKIYDVNVSLEVISPLNRLEKLEVRLIPIKYEYFITRYRMRREDYPLVFPPEERVIKLEPKGLERETFSATFTNLKGGKEYIINAVAKDVAGNTKAVEIKTPYMREFENFGEVLYQKGILVFSVYIPFDMMGIPRKDDDPLLGRYDTMDEIVAWKHVDWATGAGINVFIMDSQNHWWPDIERRVFTVYNNIIKTEQIRVAWLVGPSRRHFIYEEYGKEIPVWAIDLSILHNHDTFISFVRELLTPEYVLNRKYLMMKNRPVLYIWDEGAFFNQKSTYQAVRNLINEMFGTGLYIIADWIPRIPTLPTVNKYRVEGLKVVDAYTGWIGFHHVGLDTEEYVNNYTYYYEKHLREWRGFTKSWGKDFIVTITPGFDNSYSWGDPQIPLPRGRDKFEERLIIALKYLDESKPMIKIDTWNDWGEWSYIEPTADEKFRYLEILRNYLSKTYL